MGDTLDIAPHVTCLHTFYAGLSIRTDGCQVVNGSTQHPIFIKLKLDVQNKMYNYFQNFDSIFVLLVVSMIYAMMRFEAVLLLQFKLKEDTESNLLLLG